MQSFFFLLAESRIDQLSHNHESIIARLRLDAGTFGTMGVGTGFAIAAALLAESQVDGSNPPRRVVCVQGDSAFGFSGMELETACR